MAEEGNPDRNEAIARTRVELPVSDNITLRQFAPEDAEPLFDLIDRNRGHLDGRVWSDTAKKYPDAEAVRREIAESTGSKRLRFGIWEADHLVGTVNLTPHEHGDDAMIDYWLGEEYTGLGFATEATARVTEYARELGYDRTYAAVDAEHEKSIGVLARAGYYRIGRIGQTREVALFVDGGEQFTEADRQARKEAAVWLGLQRGEAIYHDGKAVMAMNRDEMRRVIAHAEDMNALWHVAALALEHGPKPEPEELGGIRAREVYVHPDGPRYRVDGFVIDATGHERKGKLVFKVVYTQLDDGEKKPAGTQYVRELEEFKDVFSRQSDA